MDSVTEVSQISFESQVLQAINDHVNKIVAEEIEAAQQRVKDRIWIAVAQGAIGVAQAYNMEMRGHQLVISVDMKGLIK